MIDGAAQSLRIDRTFVDEAGVRWIVDWKTSAHEGGDREAFLDNELERYRGQLERYAHAMKLLEPDRPLKVGLYFPLLDAWRGSLERPFDREGAPALAVRRAEKTQRVEDRGTGAGARRSLAPQQVTAVLAEFDRPAHAQRPAEVAQPAVEGLGADRAFADHQFEIAQQLATRARGAQCAQQERAARAGRTRAR